ncbi:hypothetical protein AB0H34_13550, partial [Saccharopolyspora shandongensis]|uniref:hypothetical protein n=1 Tax=Saccharopolyspora shandongensis TaxID=418495 RepID=UPI003409F023
MVPLLGFVDSSWCRFSAGVDGVPLRGWSRCAPLRRPTRCLASSSPLPLVVPLRGWGGWRAASRLKLVCTRFALVLNACLFLLCPGGVFARKRRSYAGTVSAFTFRCQVPAERDDD